MPTKWIITVASTVYGTEQFVYSSQEEAIDGMERLLTSAQEAMKKDCIMRFLQLYPKEEE